MKQLLITVADYVTAAYYNRILPDFRLIVREEVQAMSQALPATRAEHQQLLTIREAADFLQVCPQTIHQYKKIGVLAYKKIQGRSYILREDLLLALESHQRLVKKPGRSHARR